MAKRMRAQSANGESIRIMILATGYFREDMERQFTRQAENALKLAKTTAKTCGHGYIGTEHLLAGLLKEPEGTAGKVLQEFNVEEEKLRELISSLVTPVQGNTAAAETKDPQYSPRARRIIEQAKEDAESMECLCGTEHLLLSLLKETDCVATRLLFTMGVNIQKLFVAILTAMGFDNDTIAEEFQYARNAGNKKVTSTPTLDQYSRDLTQLAAEGKLDPVIGRDKEITRLIQILSRRTKNNPCLTGEPGVGKTAIVEGLAQRIVMGMVPDTVKDKRLVVLDLSGMVAGSKYRGEFEERIKNVIQEVKEHQGILLFIDEIHTIIGAGGAEGALDASNILKPSLSRGEIQLIGATTLEEYRKYIEKDAALERRFQPVTVEEPSSEETVEILKGLRPYYEKHHGVKIEDEALEAAVKMSQRYINDRFLPDKAIDIIDEAASKVQLAGYQSAPEMEQYELELNELREEKEQAPGLMDMSVIRNTNTKIILGLPDLADRELVGRAAGLNEDQIFELSRLKTFVAAVYQNNWLEPVLCNIDTNFKNVSKYSYDCKTKADEDKMKYLEYLLLPIDKRNKLDARYIDELVNGIYTLRIPAESKAAFIRYTKAVTKDEVQKLRGQVVYSLFNSEIAFGLAKGKENNISSWYDCIKEMLEPDIMLLSENDQQKIIALLTKEQARIDGTAETVDLFERLMDHI